MVQLTPYFAKILIMGLIDFWLPLLFVAFIHYGMEFSYHVGILFGIRWIVGAMSSIALREIIINASLLVAPLLLLDQIFTGVYYLPHISPVLLTSGSVEAARQASFLPGVSYPGIVVRVKEYPFEIIRIVHVVILILLFAYIGGLRWKLSPKILAFFMLLGVLSTLYHKGFFS